MGPVSTGQKLRKPVSVPGDLLQPSLLPLDPHVQCITHSFQNPSTLSPTCPHLHISVLNLPSAGQAVITPHPEDCLSHPRLCLPSGSLQRQGGTLNDPIVIPHALPQGVPLPLLIAHVHPRCSLGAKFKYLPKVWPLRLPADSSIPNS